MKLSLLVAIPALFAPIAAQTKSKCAAGYQIPPCVKSADNAIKACGSDPTCFCQKNKDKALCYINCPNDEYYQGQAKLQEAITAIYCSVPSAITTTVSKSANKPAPTDDSNHTKPSDSFKDKDKDASISGTSGSISTPKSGNSGNAKLGSLSFVAISMESSPLSSKLISIFYSRYSSTRS